MEHNNSAIRFLVKGFIQVFSILFIVFFVTSVAAREITLTWEANSEPDLSHYIVYWGNSSGNYTDNSGNIGLTNEYTTDIPDDGQKYYFAVTAVDEAGLESDFSNEVNSFPGMFISTSSNWNLISLPNVAENTPIEDALGPIMDDVVTIWAYVDGVWKHYNPETPNTSTLLEVRPGQGLWLNMRGNAELYIPETVPVDGVHLSQGWNLVGLNSASILNMPQAISSILNNVISIWTYQDGKWKVYDPENPNFSDLTSLKPGYGYWIKVNSACTWRY
ncbi:MAG: hypothetical protein JW927_07070 [Deltaproteobacteria bacterium]|nr:hypothetical protein [Deltaproteobacteria bacterium]